MKNYLAGVVLSVAAVSSVYAQTAASDTLATAEPLTAASDTTAVVASPDPAGQASLPPGVITEQNPLKLAIITAKHGTRAYYRPNDSMPDLSNEDLLRGYLSPGKTIEQARGEVVGYMPRLRVLPCSDGCSGSAYEEAVDALKKGYRGSEANIVERGEMIVRISRFHHRSFLGNLVPTFNDAISIQFVLQGRLVTLSQAGTAIAAHGTGGDTTKMAEVLGGRLGEQLLLDLGVGIAPYFATPSQNRELAHTLTAVQKVLNVGLNAVGTDTEDSSVGPVPDGDVQLLPAIDGIGPNEVEPLTETYTF